MPILSSALDFCPRSLLGSKQHRNAGLPKDSDALLAKPLGANAVSLHKRSRKSAVVDPAATAGRAALLEQRTRAAMQPRQTQDLLSAAVKLRRHIRTAFRVHPAAPDFTRLPGRGQPAQNLGADGDEGMLCPEPVQALQGGGCSIVPAGNSHQAGADKKIHCMPSFNRLRSGSRQLYMAGGLRAAPSTRVL